MPAVDGQTVITTLTIAAGLALAIERTIELLKYIIGSANGSLGAAEIKDLIERARQIVNDTKAAIAAAGNATPSTANSIAELAPAPAAAQPQLQAAADGEAGEQYPAPAIPVIPPTPLSAQQTGRQLFYLLSAFGLGIILADAFNIRMLALFSTSNGLPVTPAPLLSLCDVVFTGFVIGGGSQPFHALIKFLTERKVTLEVPQDKELAAVEKSTDLAAAIADARLVEDKKESAALQWRDIAYHGGINPAALQTTHLRPGNPNLIVYHHTAMASSLPFQAVVDEFLLNKQWLTGYHCVIMPDGAIMPFCRWDRSGNHAMGHNGRSLGIAFHGNFHTEPGDKFSNADGRYGNQQPTEAQLHAGARVVALWLHLYPELSLDFECSILPHKALRQGHTVCPGSNFNYSAFKQLIRQYHQAWMESAQAQQRIAAFKQLDYLYI